MIINVNSKNINQLAALANKLWPDNSIEDLKTDFEASFETKDEEAFLYKDTLDNIVGFIQLSVRVDYVEGSEATPVAYIEGIYVEEEARRSGVAKDLAAFAEKWGKDRGCKEIASDCELNNTLSIDFHEGIGFKEANRIVCFIKKIGE